MDYSPVFAPPPLYFESDGSDFEEKEEEYFAQILIPYLNARYGINIPKENAGLVTFKNFAMLDPSLNHEIIFLGTELIQDYTLEVSDFLDSEDLVIFKKDLSDQSGQNIVELDRVGNTEHSSYRMNIEHIYSRPPLSTVQSFVEYRVRQIFNESKSSQSTTLQLAFCEKGELPSNPQYIFGEDKILNVSLSYFDEDNEDMEAMLESSIVEFAQAATSKLLESSSIMVLGARTDYRQQELSNYSKYDYAELDTKEFFSMSFFHSPQEIDESKFLNMFVTSEVV